MHIIRKSSRINLIIMNQIENQIDIFSILWLTILQVFSIHWLKWLQFKLNLIAIPFVLIAEIGGFKLHIIMDQNSGAEQIWLKIMRNFSKKL